MNRGLTPDAPSISVVMPVRNARPYLDEAVESILNQTHEDLELVVLDDQSTDGSGKRLEEWAQRDSRIRLFDSRSTLGLSGSSQRVVSFSRAPLIARMDADDISHPTRLARQMDVFRDVPDAVLVATLWEGMTTDGRPTRSRDRWRLWRGRPYAPFTHGSIMFKRSAFDAVGGYRAEAVFWEDFDIYLRLSKLGRILVVPDALYRYRFHLANSRITANRDEFRKGMDLFRRCVREFQIRGDYDHLLSEDFTPADDDGSADAYILFVETSTRIWCGTRPKILRTLVERRIFPTSSLKVRLWTFAVAGDLAPTFFLFVLRAFVRARDFVASLALSGSRPVEWRYPRPDPRVGSEAETVSARSEVEPG